MGSGATLFCMERERATFKMARSGAWPCQGRGPHFAPRTLFPRLHSLHSGEHSLGVSLIMISLPASDQPFSQSRKGLAERRSERPTRQSLRLRYRSDVAGGSGARGGGVSGERAGQKTPGALSAVSFRYAPLTCSVYYVCMATRLQTYLVHREAKWGKL